MFFFLGNCLENGGIKRSNSATSISSKSSEEALFIAGGKETDEEKIRKQQHRILNDIKANQKSKIDNQIDGFDEPAKNENLSFHDEHFQRSPKVSSELPHQFSAGQSTFYQPRERASAPCTEEVHVPEGNNYHHKM